MTVPEASTHVGPCICSGRGVGVGSGVGAGVGVVMGVAVAVGAAVGSSLRRPGVGVSSWGSRGLGSVPASQKIGTELAGTPPTQTSWVPPGIQAVAAKRRSSPTTETARRVPSTVTPVTGQTTSVFVRRSNRPLPARGSGALSRGVGSGVAVGVGVGGLTGASVGSGVALGNVEGVSLTVHAPKATNMTASDVARTNQGRRVGGAAIVGHGTCGVAPEHVTPCAPVGTGFDRQRTSLPNIWPKSSARSSRRSPSGPMK